MLEQFRQRGLNISFSLGRLFDIDIRVHLLFLLWIAFALLQAGPAWLWHLIFLVLLFGLVLLHELGHSLGARRVGGEAHTILLWPLGGLATVSAPMTPSAQAITAAAGPAVNLVFCILSGAYILVATGFNWHYVLINPFGGMVVPPGGYGTVFVALFYQVNALLLSFNLLPVYPLDGGKLLECALWSRMGRFKATQMACQVGIAGAIGFVLWGMMTPGGMLLFIGLLGGFHCYQKLQYLEQGFLVEGFDDANYSGSSRAYSGRSSGVYAGRSHGSYSGRTPPGAGRMGGWSSRLGSRLRLWRLRAQQAWWRLRGTDRDAGQGSSDEHSWLDSVDGLDPRGRELLKKVETKGVHTLTEREREELTNTLRKRREKQEYLH